LPEFANVGTPVSADAGDVDFSVSETPSALTVAIVGLAGFVSAFA